MNKETFNNLNFEEKISYINTKLIEGETVSKIRESLGIGEKALQREIKSNGYKYNNKLKQYVANTNSNTTSNTNENKIIIDLIDDKHLNPKAKAFRVNMFVYKQWQEFCEKQRYSKQDLLSMAMKEYMEKYK